MTVISFPDKARLPMKPATFDDSQPPPRFVCQDTTPANGGNFRGNIITTAIALVAFGLLGQIHWTIGLAAFTWFIGCAAYFGIKGLPDFYREAPCLHCGTTIQIRNIENKACNCETCGERVVLRKSQLQYVHRCN